MEKFYFLSVFIVLALYTVFLNTEKTINFRAEFRQPSEAPGARKIWDIKRFSDPNSGQLPSNIHTKELAFASALPNDLGNSNLNWIAQGPYNVGGRTRAVAIDVTDENILIAGGASGGIWRSTNLGESWEKMTRPFQLHNVTCIDQDTREGKEHIWYHGTGELTGSSASGGDAYFQGNGIYKSTDGGITWDSIQITASNTPQSFDNDFDFIWNIALDPSNETEDEVYAATYGSIYKSLDGGESWELQLGGGYAYYNNIEVSSEGIVYATLSSDGTDKGIWRSEDGANWTNILPDNFPNVYGRTAIGINPSNEDEVYFLTAETEGSGQHTNVFFGGETWTSLWKYTYLCEDGLDTCGTWENLSMNIPANRPTTFDNFNAQGGYDLLIKVKPDEPNVVFIGGTNLWRSTDGFTSDTNTTQVGGYYEGSDHGYDNWDIYDTHHPDQHELLFLPSNPNVIISGNDGGIYKSDNCLATPHLWQRLNNGYQTTQLYSVTMGKENSDIIIGGFQDNGNFITFSDDPNAIWTMPFNGDGSFNAIANNEEDYYLQIQRGVLFKMKLNEDGEVIAYNRMDPLGADTTAYQFINYLAMDPNNDDIIYFPEGKKLWRNNASNDFPYNNSQERISDGWDLMPNSNQKTLTCVKVSKNNPSNRVYVGTENKIIYKIDNAHEGTPEFISIGNIPTGPNVYITDIAIHPENADIILVVVSNYNSQSLFFSEDAGENWNKVGGNLEPSVTGSGNGPSMRTAVIIPFENQTLYLAGGSTGLYAAHTLNSENTEWTQIGTHPIGSVVVEHMVYRKSDGKLVVGTHGTGVYTTHITSITDVFPDFVSIQESNRLSTDIIIYPNPSNSSVDISWENNYNELFVFNSLGKEVKRMKITNQSKFQISVEDWQKGIYYITLQGERSKQTQKLIVQ